MLPKAHLTSHSRMSDSRWVITARDYLGHEDVFLEFSCFFHDPADVGNLISGSSTFLKPAWTSGSSLFTYCWSLAWRILSITFLACEMSAIVRYFEHSLALPFFGIGIKTDLFQSCGHCWVFQICWHIEWSIFRASSFRIWNSSTGIASPPLALFIMMLPKAHLTSHSRMSGSRWVITPLWLSSVWITIKCGKFWKTWEYQTTRPAS